MANTLPDVNADEILAQLDARHARLPAHPPERGRHRVRRRGERQRGPLRPDGRAGPARGVQALRADRARRRALHAPADPAPAATSSGSSTTSRSCRRRSRGATTSSRRWWTRRTPTSRPSPRRRTRCARPCASSRARSSQTETTLRKAGALADELGPALQRLRPFARELAPALRKTRPFFEETTPIIRDQIRPFARDVQPTVRDLRLASEDLAVVTPRLTRSFKVLNRFFNTLAYNPPGATEPFLFWAAGAPTRARRSGRSRTRTGRSGAASCSWAARPTTRSSRS